MNLKKAVIKNKEFMFPCLDMTKKDDLRFVLDFLHKEHNLCPSPDQVEKEDLTRDDEDFEDERLLTHLISFSSVINKVEKSLGKENVLPKLLKQKSGEWDIVAASYKPKWNGKTPETLKVIAHVGAAANLPASMRSLIKDEHKFDLLSIWAGKGFYFKKIFKNFSKFFQKFFTEKPTDKTHLQQ